MANLKIGEVARLSGTSAGTIRFYERIGLLPLPPRTPSNYRKYTLDAVHRLQVIRRLRELGFSIPEVAEVINGFARQCPTCEERQCRAAQKLSEVDRRIQELQQIKNELNDLLTRCEVGRRQCSLAEIMHPLGAGMPSAGSAPKVRKDPSSASLPD